MTELIKRLQRLSGENPVAYVKLLPEDWPEIAGIIEDAARYRWLRDAGADERNRLEHYAGPALEEAIDAARTTTKETK